MSHERVYEFDISRNLELRSYVEKLEIVYFDSRKLLHIHGWVDVALELSVPGGLKQYVAVFNTKVPDSYNCFVFSHDLPYRKETDNLSVKIPFRRLSGWNHWTSNSCHIFLLGDTEVPINGFGVEAFFL